MAKLLVKFTNAPDGVNPEQLFDDKNHLTEWINADDSKFTGVKITKSTITFDGGSATIEEKPNDFTN